MPGWYRYELAEFLFRMLDISEVIIKTMSRRAGVWILSEAVGPGREYLTDRDPSGFGNGAW